MNYTLKPQDTYNSKLCTFLPVPHHWLVYLGYMTHLLNRCYRTPPMSLAVFVTVRSKEGTHGTPVKSVHDFYHSFTEG